MNPCRDALGNLPCQREGGHSGPHRNKLTVWATRIPRWLERARKRGGLPALDLTNRSAS